MISTGDIENLIPEFLLESDHFFTVLLDVEGKVLRSSNIQSGVESSGLYGDFIDRLANNSQQVFLDAIESLLGSPKEKKQILLTPKESQSKRSESIWWEFSVITNNEMDILGIVGIGVGIPFLEEEMPWVSLVDLLRFGKIRLNSDFIVEDFDDKVGDWLAIGRSHSSTNGEQFLAEIPQKLSHLSTLDKPACLLIQDSNSGIDFSAIFLSLNRIPHLFILPRAKQAELENLDLPFSSTQLNSLTGSVWVINRDFEFIQQNPAAKEAVLLWTGRSDVNSFSSILRSNPDELRRFSKFLENAFDGNSSEIELKINPLDSKASFWFIGIKPIYDVNGLVKSVLVNGVALNRLSKRLSNLESENRVLKELVLKPSHILRSPLSSMLGLLDLIDTTNLDSDNQKYFSYLKPLAKELDEAIRTNAKQISRFD